MYPTEFEAFYLEYPRKIEKKNAFLTWQRLTKKQQKEVILAAKNYAKAMQVEQRELEYMKYPKSFISPRREIWKEFLKESESPSDAWLKRKIKELKEDE